MKMVGFAWNYIMYHCDVFLWYLFVCTIDSDCDQFIAILRMFTRRNPERKGGSFVRSLHNCIPILHAMYNNAVQPRRNQNMRSKRARTSASVVVYVSRRTVDSASFVLQSRKQISFRGKKVYSAFRARALFSPAETRQFPRFLRTRRAKSAVDREKYANVFYCNVEIF